MTVWAGATVSSAIALAGLVQEPRPPQDPDPLRENQGPPELVGNEEGLFRPPRTAQSTTRGEVELVDAPSSVSTLDGDEIDRLGIRFLSDAFRILPGFEVMRLTSSESGVSARGYNDVPSSSQGMLGLVDGRLVYNEFFGTVFWDAVAVSMDGILGIEGVRGPGSFLYGPNAMHGVLSIYTRSPLDYAADTTTISAFAGPDNSIRSSLTQVTRDEESGFKTTLSWAGIDSFDSDSGTDGEHRFFELRFAKELEEARRFELTAGVNEQKLDVLVPLLGLPATIFHSDLRETFVKADFGPADGDAHGLKAQLFWTGWHSRAEPEDFYPAFDVDLDTVDLDLQYSWAVSDRHELTSGVGSRFATARTEDADVTDGRQDTNLTWAFVQDEVELDENWTVTAGVRLDEHTVSGLNMSPRVAAVRKVGEQDSVRMSAGFGFRNPSLRESWFDMPVDTGGPLGTVQVLGNDDLEAEWIRSFELGYYFGSTDADVRGSVSVFYNEIDDLIVFRTNVADQTVTPVNDIDERAYGVELDGSVLVSDSTSLFANYAYVESENRDTGDRRRVAPRHKANAGTRYTPGDGFGLRAMLWANYYDDVVLEGGPVDSYALLNGQVSYPVGADGRFYLQAFNLLDDDHREHPDGESYGALWQVGYRMSW